jgi:hypothetical protein
VDNPERDLGVGLFVTMSSIRPTPDDVDSVFGSAK